MPRCKACGATITFIKMQGTGRLMPCDYSLVGYKRDPDGKDKLITPNGVVFSCTVEKEKEKAVGMAFMSHFATCPKAAKFRKK